jgi:hypothetical protein
MEPENKIEVATVTPEFIKEGVEDSSEAAAMLEPEIKLEIKEEPSDDSTTTVDFNIMEPEIKLEIKEEPSDNSTTTEDTSIMEPEIKLEIKGEPPDDSTTTEDTNIMEPEIKLEEGAAVKLEIHEEPEAEPWRGCQSVK